MVEKADVEIEGLTVIAGNNDTGKSTIGKVAYSLAKSFEDAELNYEELKNTGINLSAKAVYKLIRRHLKEPNRSFIDVYFKLRDFAPFFPYQRDIQPGLLKTIDELKKILDNADKANIEIEKSAKERIYEEVNRIQNLSREALPSASKIELSLERIFESEFRKDIINKFASKARINLSEGGTNIIDIKFEKLDGRLMRNMISYKEIEKVFPVDSAIFIETPLILAYERMSQRSRMSDFEDFGTYHLGDLMNKLKRMSKKNEGSVLNISKTISGSIHYDKDSDRFSFKKKRGDEEIAVDILNSASGIRSFGILQLLDASGEFDKPVLLIIDEPEVHLHPDWQVEYANLLAQLARKGVKVLVTSHSPYMIKALDNASKEAKIEDLTKFYLSKLNKEGNSEIVDRISDKGEIFDKLSQPFEKLVFGE